MREGNIMIRFQMNQTKINKIYCGSLTECASSFSFFFTSEHLSKFIDFFSLMKVSSIFDIFFYKFPRVPFNVIRIQSKLNT